MSLKKDGSVLLRAGNQLITNCDCCGGGCSGMDPLCSHCDCSNYLSDIYYVTISGMPSVCTAQAFNGVWPLAWQQDCVWWYDIDSYRRVTLSISTGWYVGWAVSGGANGDFSGSDGTGCRPETATWLPNNCFEPFGCWGLRTQFLAYAACTVSE